MKTRFTRIRNLASSKAKGATFGILLFLLAFAVPRFDNAQDKTNSSKSSQQLNPATVAKGTTSDTLKEAAGKKAARLSTGAITDVKAMPEAGTVIVSVTTDQLAAPQEFILDDPPRLVLDFPNMENRVKLARLPVDAVSLKQLRVQQFRSTPVPIARVVLDLADGYGAHELTVDKTVVRLVLHNGPPKVVQPPVGPPKPYSAEPAKSAAASTPAVDSHKSSLVKPTVASADPKPEPAVKSETEAPLSIVAQRSAPVVKAESPKPVSASGSKPQRPEPMKSAAIASSQKASQPVPVLKSELPKTVVAANNPKPRPKESAAKGEPKVPSRTVVLPPAPAVKAEPPKPAAAATDSKPNRLEPVKNAAVAPSKAAAQLAPALKSEPPKAVVAANNPKPRPKESAAKGEPKVTSRTVAQPPAPAVKAEPPMPAVAATNLKPHRLEPEKNAAVAPSKAAARLAPALKSEPPKTAVAANNPKPRPKESVAKGEPEVPSPTIAQPPASAVKAESPKPAVAATDSKPHRSESLKNAAVASSTAASQPAPALKSEPPRTAVAANDPKPRLEEPAVKNPAAASPAPTQPALMPRSEPPKSTAVEADPKPRPAEPSAKASQAQEPMVATLAPASIPAPPKMLASPSSPFTGQPLTLDLIDMPLVDFFRLMSEEGGINIVIDPEVKGRTSIKVVKLPWDQIFDAVLANHGLDKRVEGNLVRVAKKSTLQDEAKQQEALKKATLLAADLDTQIKRLNYTKASTLVQTLADQKTVRGTVVVDERTNSLILTDIPSSLVKLTKLVETLDVAQPQVEIEARIVSATRDFARNIGIQFGFVDGNLQRVTVGGPNTFGTIGGTRPSATPTSTFAAGNPITGRGASNNKISGSASVSTGTSTTNQGNFNVNLPAITPFGGLGISIGNIFDTFLLDAAITAGESKGQAKLISQPKVVAQNNSLATITQGLRFPVQVIANNTISVQFQNAALTLTVTPQITYEGNIVLDLKVENNTPDFANQVNGIPSIRTSESTTRVLVSDGGTTVIGGILLEDESKAEDKVPGLGSLPLLGNLFRRTSVSRSTQEVLFFVTPRIIK